MVKAIGSRLGVDSAVAFTFSGRLVNILSSTGTVLLIVRFLTPIEQGYYYTLLSLMSLQVIFELGFSFVILQLAAHESVHLTLRLDGRIEGDAVAHARLASILQITVRWYLRAAIVLAMVLIPAGIVFFSLKTPVGPTPSIIGPVVLGVIAVSLNLLITPLYSFFEGCNQVREVAFIRMCQGFAVLAASWVAIASGHGLYASAFVNCAVVLVGTVFFYRRRRLVFALLGYSVASDAVLWRSEIWPFQWKIGVSWLCSYFTLQVFTPILFSYRGPLEAGQMGLSLSITGYLPIIALCWVNTKAATFGRLIKLGNLNELDDLFFRTLRQSFAIILFMTGACFVAVVAIQRFSPAMVHRMVAPKTFVFLLLTALSNFMVQSLGVYLRSFKREPYLVQSVVVSGFTVLGVFAVVERLGAGAVALVYFVLSGVVALLWAGATFNSFRSAQKSTAVSI